MCRYNVNGFVEELPPLPKARRAHACTSLPNQVTGISLSGKVYHLWEGLSIHTLFRALLWRVVPMALLQLNPTRRPWSLGCFHICINPCEDITKNVKYLLEHLYANGNILIMVTFLPGEAAWTEIATLPRSLYAPRASLVGRRMRVTGGRSTGGKRDYRAEVKIGSYLSSGVHLLFLLPP